MTACDGGDLFKAAAPRVFSIDSGRPFLIDLARTLGRAVGNDPVALADVQIFTPTRRAARALTEAFVATAPGGCASLLPQIRPLGDVDEDELALGSGEDVAEIDLPPAVSKLERRLVLAKMTAAAERAFAGQENWPAALAAAKELSALLDSFYAEEVDFGALKNLAPTEHAEHWDHSLKFLEIITEQWPAYLAAGDFMDPAERRAKLIDLQAERFHRNPPETPVIIAGTTGSAPAVARLMRVVAQLPRGAVILPGLDHTLALEHAKAWAVIDDPHPQAGLKSVLDALEIAPKAVANWPGSDEPASTRAGLLSLALRPAEATDDWRELVSKASAADPSFQKARDGLTLVEAADEEGEASAISILLRGALETQGRTAMLVTPDRTLTRRVAAKMRRWGVTVDDSAGIPFANSPCGTYLRLVVTWLAAPADPAAALALAKHPLAGFGVDGPTKNKALSAFDKGLRGLAPQPGPNALAEKLKSNDALAAAAQPIVEGLESAYASWPQASTTAFSDYLAAHIDAAEQIAATAEESGAERLWRGEDGEAGATLLAELGPVVTAMGEITNADYAASFTQVITGQSVRRHAPAHPRLSVLGPLEARLQSADFVILGGLNEGVWPGEAAIDPFLSRPMRQKIGLPSPERRIGLAAHDFAQLASMGDVVLTRATRAGGAPAKLSRWLVRLKNILAGADALKAIDKTEVLAAWAESLDAAVENPQTIPAPRPKPPVEARPRKLYVTQVEKWLRDPYAIYARHILHLKKLDPVGETFAPRHLGSLLHKTFEKFARDGGDLNEIFQEFASEFGFGEIEDAFWGPSISETFAWFSKFHADRLTAGDPVVLEETGEAILDADYAPFAIKARADRIDLLKSGGAALFDYKSRHLPSIKQQKAFSPQLPLTAFIVERGGFDALGKQQVASFHYLRTVARPREESKCEVGAEGSEAAAIIGDSAEGLAAYITLFDDENTPYLSQPRAEFTDDFGDYDLLARRRERLIEGTEE